LLLMPKGLPVCRICMQKLDRMREQHERLRELNYQMCRGKK
jgi:hypothetical protein